MKVRIDLRRSVQENASDYFERAKKARKKLAGVSRAMEETRKRLAGIGEKTQALERAEPAKKRACAWFEKFHWFVSSDGILVVAGRDAKSNEELLKKHADSSDLYFHADVHGAPHTIAKCGKGSVPEKTREEAARFAAAFSSAWRSGISAVDVYSAKPGQVSKSAPSGEALSTGAFMVYGSREWHRKTPLEFAIGIKEEGGNDIVVSGPPGAVEKQAGVSVRVAQGTEDKGALAKKIKRTLEEKLNRRVLAPLDEIISMLPAGGGRIAEKEY